MHIITHKGQAHFDEFMACCYLIAAHPSITYIGRRDPDPKDLDDPETIVVDVGRLHQPENNNFDHHQFDRDAPPTCALSLVLQSRGDYDDWCTVFPWMKMAEQMDSKGPFAVAKSFGIKPDDLIAVASNPIAGFMLTQFQEHGIVVPGSDMWAIMLLIGDHLINKVNRCRSAWSLLDASCGNLGDKTIRFGVDEHGARTLHAIDATCLGTDFTGLESWCQRRSFDVAVTITEDDRGEGLSFFRRNDHPQVDFSQAVNHKDCHFAHVNGFVFKSKTKDCDIHGILEQAFNAPPY